MFNNGFSLFIPNKLELLIIIIIIIQENHIEIDFTIFL